MVLDSYYVGLCRFGFCGDLWVVMIDDLVCVDWIVSYLLVSYLCLVLCVCVCVCVWMCVCVAVWLCMCVCVCVSV